MVMRLYNTRTRQIEKFKSIEEGKVKMYSCGPTVYDHAHIGNLRAFTFADLLKKALQFEGYRVTHVMNITDFGHLVGDGDNGEDKMSVGLKREDLPRTLSGMKTLAEKYTKLFLDDIEKMNIAKFDHMPFASEHIDEYVNIIQKLQDKKIAYTTSDGIYFDTDKDVNYGKMALLDRVDKANEESRLSANGEKKNNRDFALWKFSGKFADKSGIGFDSPFGFGFPGWHIECSGMSRLYLGETFDIHTGGVDHIAVHHTNEIAQSENANSKTYANFFCHCEFINVNDVKMSKSKDNFLTLNSIESEGIDALAYRHFLLQSHYRQNTNFTLEALQASATALSRLKNTINNLKTNLQDNTEYNLNIKISEKYIQEFKSTISDDLNTAKALATLNEMLKDINVNGEEKYFTALEFDKVLSLDLDKIDNEKEVSPEVQKLIDERENYRKEKNWLKSDEIRNTLLNMGYKVEDK
jgi:cysteinyl-tRNA synthetase